MSRPRKTGGRKRLSIGIPASKKRGEGSSLKCPFCGHDITMVLDSFRCGATRGRVRACGGCGKRFHTEEVPFEYEPGATRLTVSAEGRRHAEWYMREEM